MKTIYYKELFEGLPIKITACRDSEVSMHQHAFLEFVYVCHGKAEHIFENHSAIVQKGDFFLIDRNRAHEYRRIGADDSFRIINCLFLPRFVDPACADDSDLSALTESTVLSASGVSLSSSPAQKIFHDDTGLIGTLIEQMLREFEEKKLGYEDVLHHLLCTVLLQLVRNERSESSDPAMQTVRAIRSYVEENYASPLLLSDIAKQLNFSLPYISTLFRREVGMTFRDYLIRVRIEKGCHLLRSSDLTVREVAEQVGYTDPAFFYKSFRREMDMTPDDYRRQHRSI